MFILAFAGGWINSRVDDALCVRSVTRHARGGSAAGNSFPSTCRARVLYSYPAERVLLFIYNLRTVLQYLSHATALVVHKIRVSSWMCVTLGLFFFDPKSGFSYV